MHRSTWSFAAALSSCLPACSAPGVDLLDDPLAPWPPRLSEVGVYPNPSNRAELAAGALPFEPGWPLWSSGSDKQRVLALPAGTAIDNTSGSRWRFPIGTMLFKTFSYHTPAWGSRPVETRVLRKLTHDGPQGWEYAVYRWNDAGEDAELLDLEISEPVTLSDGTVHTIPARLECRMCHETAPHPVLGFEPLQLAAGPGTGGSALDGFAAAGVFARPPAAAPRISSEDPLERAVLGMFYGNCVHCHNGGDGDNASFDLSPELALANTIGQPTQSSASAEGIRIVPGAPERSILFLALSGEHDDPDLEDMPPVGIDRRDDAAIASLRAFIIDLEMRQ